MNDEIVLVYNSQQPGPGTFELVNSTPADGAVLTGSYGYAAASFTLTFGENVVIKNNAPAITFTKDGAAVSDVEEWHLTTGSNAVDALVWGSDMDGYTASFRIDENATYTLTVPAGVIANAAGDLNEEIMLTFYGSDKAKYGTLDFVSSNPENEGTFNLNAQGMTFVTFDLTFSDAVKINSQAIVNEVKLYEGELNGTEIEPEFGNWSASMSSDKKTLSIFSLDEYGEGLMMMQPKEETKYYLVVPANIVVTDKNLGNEAITIVINGPEKQEPEQESVTTDPMDKSTIGTLNNIVIDQLVCPTEFVLDLSVQHSPFKSDFEHNHLVLHARGNHFSSIEQLYKLSLCQLFVIGLTPLSCIKSIKGMIDGIKKGCLTTTIHTSNKDDGTLFVTSLQIEVKMTIGFVVLSVYAFYFHSLYLF